MANKKIDVIGKRFGKLVAIRELKEKKDGRIVCECQCDCENVVDVKKIYLTTGETISCGCARKQGMDNARNNLLTAKTVDGMQIPLLKKKVRSDSGTGVKGVHRRVTKKGMRYEPSITVKGKRIYLGVYYNLEDAVKARKQAENKYHKPYLDQLEDNKNENK